MIIGITGFKGSGKSVAAKYLREQHSFLPVNFKDSLIEEIKEKFPEVLESIQYFYQTQLNNKAVFKSIDSLFIEKPPLVRVLMQNYGTEVRRADDPDYWVKRWSDKVHSNDSNVVTDDVRFLNEADAVREAGGVVIRIVKNGQTSTDSHASEVEMNQIEPDFTIYADEGRHDSIADNIDRVISEIKQNND